MRCFECDNLADHEHHVVPRIKGGTKTVPLCGSCHAKVHGSDNLLSINSLTQVALDKKKRKGERVGAIPYGFDLKEDQKTLIKNEREQDVIQAIILARLSNFSLLRIARWLTAAGISTKTGKNKKWGHQVITKILEREASGLKMPVGEYFSEFKKHIAAIGIKIMI